MPNILVGVKVASDEAKAKLQDLIRTTNAASSSGGTLGGVLSGIGAGVGIAGVLSISSAASTLAQSLEGAVAAASDLSEQQSKANVVFGKSAGVVAAFARTSASSYAISTRAALEATGTLGNMFTAMGIGQQKAASMSVEMVKLAGDLASFNNIPVDVALEKLRAGLAGEIEPLRTLGVNLSDVALRQQALAMGLQVTAAPLDAQTKTLAAYELILKQTATAQGDFARTSDSLANQQRALQATMENLSAKVGSVLVPALAEVARTLNNAVEALDSVSVASGDTEGGFSALDAAGQAFSTTVGMMSGGLGPLIAIMNANAEAADKVRVSLDGAAVSAKYAAINQGPTITAYVNTGRAALFAAERIDILRDAEAGADMTARIAATGAWTATSAFYAQAAGLDRAGLGISRVADGVKEYTKSVSGSGGASRATQDFTTAVGKAFDALRTKVTRAFDAIHEKNLRQIEDTRRMRDEALQGQIDAIQATVDAAQAALDRQRDAARQADLERAVAEATTAEDRAAAQAALDDFLAQKRIDAMQADADVAIAKLKSEQESNDRIAADATKAEEDRDKKQREDFERELANLETHLKNKETTWKKANADLLKLLDKYDLDFEAVGKKMGTSYASGYTKGVNSALKSIAAAVAKLLGLDEVTLKQLAAGTASAGTTTAAAGATAATGGATATPTTATSTSTAPPTGAQSGGSSLTFNVTINAGAFTGTQADAKKFAADMWAYFYNETDRRQREWPPKSTSPGA